MFGKIPSANAVMVLANPETLSNFAYTLAEIFFFISF